MFTKIPHIFGKIVLLNHSFGLILWKQCHQGLILQTVIDKTTYNLVETELMFYKGNICNALPQ